MTTDNGGRGGGGGNGDNGGPTGMVSARGVQFFVVAGCRDALIRKIEARINVGNGMSGYDAQVEVFAKAGTYAGHETDGDAWERVYNGHVAVGDNDEDEDGGPPPPPPPQGCLHNDNDGKDNNDEVGCERRGCRRRRCA